MSIILRLRMFSDEDDCFLRDYEIPSDRTLSDLYDLIVDDLRYRKEGPVSFFTADEAWNKLREFAAERTASDSGRQPDTMHDTRLSDVIRRLGDRLVYRFDPLSERAYYLETIEALQPQPGERYPRVMFSNGEAPDQFDPEKPTGNRSIFDEAMDDFSEFAGNDSYGDDE